MTCGSRGRLLRLSLGDLLPAAGLGVDNSWDLNAFRSSLRIEVGGIAYLRACLSAPAPRRVFWLTCGPARAQVTRLTDESVEFDLVGVDPAIANALRRIMISEIPTMAIEHVFFVNNTSIIQDEVLAHRLGLIPILADPSKFATRGKEDLANERNTIVLRLRHRCRTLEGEDARVYSSALEWLPGGSEVRPQLHLQSGAAGGGLARTCQGCVACPAHPCPSLLCADAGGDVLRLHRQSDGGAPGGHPPRPRAHSPGTPAPGAGDRPGGPLHEGRGAGACQVVARGHRVVQAAPGGGAEAGGDGGRRRCAGGGAAGAGGGPGEGGGALRGGGGRPETRQAAREGE